MAIPTLTPSSETSAVILPATGNADEVAAGLAFNVYGDSNSEFYSTAFLTGAADQIAYTYNKLGGEVVDIELTTSQVYTSYEEAVLEYSMLLNIHQAKNSLSDILGSPTGSFDQDGKITNALSGTHVNLRFPRFEFAYSRRIEDGISAETGLVGGITPIYSASFDIIKGQQDYDLQEIVSSSAASDSSLDFYDKVGNKRILIRRVYWKSPLAMWRFYGFYGGLNIVGNLSNYGQYADDTTFEVVPVWQHRLQANAFEEAIYVRSSHYSFEIKNNKLRIFPIPQIIGTNGTFPNKMWFTFSIPTEAYETQEGIDDGIEGVNNLGTAPYDPLLYSSINQIGKHWIRRYALACSKEILGQIRGKIETLPIPGNDITLNWGELLSQAKEEKEQLREELKTTLDELTYPRLIEDNAKLVEESSKIQQNIPSLIFVG